MKLRTELHLTPSSFAITHHTPMVAIGSCFADCMGERLHENKFNILSNPFGTIFNPLAISNLLQKTFHQENTFHTVQSQGIWQAYECHSELGNITKEILLENLDRQINITHQQLAKAKVLMITLGTAVVYTEKSLQLSVANCHKVPAHCFDKHVLTSDAIVSSLKETFDLLHAHYPELQIILTVSPVRHIKETIPLNSVSKSILRIACHALESHHHFVHYFPAFELMMDDLRDYRFYKEDLIHPNHLAETYIWTKFLDSFCNEKTKTIITQWDKAKKAIQHQPFFPESTAYRQHLVDTIAKLESLSADIDINEELAFLQTKLTNTP
jgi:hypothetical protein